VCHAKTPIRLGPQYAKLPSYILSFTPSFLLRNQASILIFSSTLNKDIILLLRLITRPRSSYVIQNTHPLIDRFTLPFTSFPKTFLHLRLYIHHSQFPCFNRFSLEGRCYRLGLNTLLPPNPTRK
jgi:hypothetical protein